MNPPSSPGGGKPGSLGGKLGKTLLYASLGGAVHSICEMAGHSLGLHELTGILSVLAPAVEVSKDLSIHVIGERIGHTWFHSDEGHPTATSFNHDIERVLARAAARTIVELMAEWEKIDRELRNIDHSQFELDDLREACNRLLHNKPNSTVPDCVREWLDKLDQADILEHTGMETASWTRQTTSPPPPCRFGEFFDWRFPAAFEGNFAEELASDAKAQVKFTLVLQKRIIELLGGNAVGIASIRSKLAELADSLIDPNAPWVENVANSVAKKIIEKVEEQLAERGLTANALSQDKLKLELASRVPNIAPDILERAISYAKFANFKADISRILKYAPAELIGRDDEKKVLSDAWYKVTHQDEKQSPTEKTRPHILTFVALGGEGKTSLIAKWAAELAGQDWAGCDAAFAWSFYSQGTREQLAASSDLFLKEALIFFGDDKDKEFAASAAGSHEKGQRLARIVGQRRSLLILDGLEPLQYAPSSPMPGQLKDQGINALLKGLTASSHGLCIVTTRYSLPDLKTYWQTTAPEMKLLRLSREAGVQLLKSFKVRGSDRKNILFNNGKEMLSEFEKIVEDVRGHALTLSLIGSYLRDAHGGDMRKRDLIKFEEADDEIVIIPDHPKHVFHVMDAYVKWFETGGKNDEENKKGLQALAFLRLLGLFDRPVTAECFDALLKPPAITGLTEPLVELNEAKRNSVLQRLDDAKLLTVNRDAPGTLVSLDAHPHLREYFARQLREQNPNAWRAAHRRLYEHLCATTQEGEHPTLEDLEPLYQAVVHGCQAGLQQEACDNIYITRINRSQECYSSRKLGALGSDLGAVACFFDKPWSRVTPKFTHGFQGWLLSEAAFSLRALGRLTEALDPMRVSGEVAVQRQEWKQASAGDSNLSELELTLGAVVQAVKDAEESLIYADRSGDAFQRMGKRTTLGDALHKAGRRTEAEAMFREAEQIQAEYQPNNPLLYSVAGFKYCDLLLVAAERAAWQVMFARIESLADSKFKDAQQLSAFSESESCRTVSERAAQTLMWVTGQKWLLDIALDLHTLGRAALYSTILEVSDLRPSASDIFHIDAAVNGLRRAGAAHYIPLSLLTRAWLRFLTGSRTGSESAQEDLDEAWEIAERGSMKLYLIDIHLYRARLFFRENPYPWNKNPDGTPRGPADDLAAAETLIKKCGYHRRDEELADAKAAILGA